ncbi:Boi-related e3 ubiquitin-protein ligase 1-like [Thalictrum thalictroides]|uniref:Boi-related e3 ubiquitin-protein ligase 1-like n=1 Tax=Thalictrum thalictroides TaxID=46969 RepID=A0A7J6VD05_THATH|nr:Boi-related e3 ubiquitin-protein ligase 1-like [Thalictrum thalictroides]
MAVQAQYMSPVLRSKNNTNVFEEFYNGNLYYNNGGGQQQFLNGTVFSEPESELTNMSGSRKRNRDDQQQLQMMNQQQQQFRFLKSSKIQESNRSEVTSTSGRTYGNDHFLNVNDLNSHLLHQNLEIEALIQLQNEKLRSGLEEARKRHCRSLLSVLELQIFKRIEEKESELANASRRNAELEEKIKQMNAENQIWFNIAKNNESIVCSLKSNLEQILLQNQGEVNEGYGDSESVTDDDAQSSSCCKDEHKTKTLSTDLETIVKENYELKQRKFCKVCHENEVSVLLLPCRHLCLCKNCESKLDSCPICNSLKNASLQIFIS